MDFKFGKDSDDTQSIDSSAEKKKQSALLVLLLILVGGFTYLYFFTGLIKPQEAAKPAAAPAPAPQAAKIPLPPREGDTAKPQDKTPQKADASKAAVSAPATAAVPAKPAAAPAKPPIPPAAVKAVPPAAPAKAKEATKKVEVAKPTDKKPLPAVAADKKNEKPAADAKKPASADKKNAPAKEAAKTPATDVQAKPEPVAKAKAPEATTWVIKLGDYVLEEELSADMGRVRKAGLDPVVKPSSRKKSAMNRLFVAEFDSRAAAQASLEKLNRLTSDAFVIEQGGKFVLYAGSYLQKESASSEKERLGAAGISATIKHTEIAIPSQSLTVGPFKNKKAADSALAKLKNAGMKASLSSK